MELRSRTSEVKYKYSSLEEKREHAKEMRKKGYKYTGLEKHEIRAMGGGYQYALCGTYEKELKK